MVCGRIQGGFRSVGIQRINQVNGLNLQHTNFLGINLTENLKTAALNDNGQAHADYIIVMLNEPGFGGCNRGPRDIVQTRSSCWQVVAHEAGHGIGGLGRGRRRPDLQRQHHALERHAPVNDAPVANSMTLPVGTEPTAITLSATDVEGDPLNYTLQTPPSHGTLSGTPPAVTYTPDTGYRGTDSFSFAASDGQASSAPATVSLTVGNSAPEVALSADSLQPFEGESVHFEAMAVDANMDPLTFDWDFGDGTASEEQNPSHAYANQGAYDVALTVSDGFVTVQKMLRLDVQNAAPVIVPLESPATAEEGKPLTLRAQASDRGSSDTLSFSWDFGDGSAPAASAETPHTYGDNGVYTVKVTVTDDSGAFTQATREVQVANMPPVPEQVPPRAVRGGETVELALKATDAAGPRDPLSWSLLEGPGTLDADGKYSWTPEPSTQGDHIVRAQVADDDSGTADVLFTVTVTPKDSTTVPDSGCACSSGAQGTASSMAFLLLLAAFARRRARA
jgi:MYXO-CTERM domain-containing protein